MADTEDPVAEALALLGQRRAALAHDLAQVDDAIEALRKVLSPEAAPGAVRRRSVRTKLVDLLEEEDRDWSAGEVVAEYQRRADPIQGADPNNALRAAIADAKKRGMIVRTTTGRYKAAKWEKDEPPERDFDPFLMADDEEEAPF